MQYPIYEEYPTLYRDAHGEESTVIRNDGTRLYMRVRGIEFTSKSPNGFEPVQGTPPAALEQFILNDDELCACEIAYDVPIPMVAQGAPAEAVLHVQLQLGMPGERGWLDSETLILRLSYDGQTYTGSGTSGWFEDELVEIQAALPEGVYMRGCINCAFSDYSPYGHYLFGSLDCHRADRAEYLKVQTKRDYLHFLSVFPVTEEVQETYCCPEFERRIPGTGYRG